MISEVKKEDQSKYKDAEEYINDNKGANKFSYHRINILIKIFVDPKNNTVNLNSTINDENLIKKMDEINKLAKAKVKKDKENKEFLVLFDEISSCNSIGLINEIFIKSSYNGTKIEENIRLIRTCNPYRLKSEKEESYGLSHPFKIKV